jgi:hypothetical protein
MERTGGGRSSSSERRARASHFDPVACAGCAMPVPVPISACTGTESERGGRLKREKAAAVVSSRVVSCSACVV